MTDKTKKLYIIDGHAHIYAGYYAPMRPLTSPDGQPTKATYVFTNMLLGLISRNKPDMLVVTMDSKGKSFRADIYPEYKAHRSPMPEDMPGQIDKIEDILKAMNIPVLRIDRYEADDIIGTLTDKATALGIDSYICSKDKDFLQLLNDHTFTYDVKKDKRTTVETLLEDMGVTPTQFLDVLALQGDTADNVPGVADVGPKTAIQWIQKYDTIENLYAHADEIKGKRGESLRNSREILDLSKTLVTIDRNAPVELDPPAFALSDFNKDALAKLFTELGFTRLLSQLELTSAQPTAPAQTKPKKGQATLFDMAAPAVTASGLKTSRSTKKHYHLIDTEEKFEKFIADLSKQEIFAVDTETTSINAMAADLVGLSFSWKTDHAYYLPVKAPLGDKVLDISLVRQKLGPILANSSVKKIGQNIKYDLLILSNANLPVSGVYFDTMVASYCLNAERRSHSMDNMARDFLGYETIPISDLIGKGKKQITFDQVDTNTACDYAAEDADITWQLYEYLSKRLNDNHEIRQLFETVEMPLVTVLAAMERNGVSLDVKLLKDMTTSISDTLGELTEKIYTSAGTVFNIDSTKQLAEVLFDHLGLESVKSGKTGRSTDAIVLDKLSDEHEIIPLVLEYRQLVKLKNTYVAKLPEMINPRTDRLHASFNQTITSTGRLSSSDPNLQNIPIRTELGKKIRGAFIPADKDGCIVSADYSQIELRLLAHFSEDEALKHAFDTDQDIHRFVASQVYDVDPDDVTSDMRSKAKAVNFGIIYGQGPFALAKSLGISLAEAKKFIGDYYARYSSIRKFMDDSIDTAKQTGYAETILHRRRPIDGLASNNHNIRSQAERLTINTIVQGSAADLIKIAMINIQQRIEKESLPIRMIIQVHDELVFELPSEDADKHLKWISDEMTSAIELNVPLKVDTATGPSWLTDK